VDKRGRKQVPHFVHRLSTGCQTGCPAKAAAQVIEVEKNFGVMRISTGLTVTGVL
jgi:hypothetical protein